MNKICVFDGFLNFLVIRNDGTSKIGEQGGTALFLAVICNRSIRN